jgi:DNA-binding CsgD family transcriptional regulator
MIDNKRKNDNISQYIRHNAKKMKMIIHKGGKCEDCGMTLIDKPPIADFHHLDVDKKEFHPTDVLGMQWDKCVEELNKCALLCTNCHRIRHYDWNRFNENRSSIMDYVDIVESKQVRRVYKDVEFTEQVLRLHSQGLFVRTISQKLDIPRASVVSILKRNNRKPNKYNAIDELTKIDKDGFTKAVADGLSSKQIADKFCCCVATVFNLATTYGVKVKTQRKKCYENIAKSRQMLADGSTKEQVCRHFAISSATLNRWLGDDAV